MTIRDARPADAGRIIEMGRTFLLNGPYCEQLEDVPEQFYRFVEALFVNPSAKILVYEDNGVHGVFAFVLVPHYLSGEQIATELIWYVEPEHRGKASLELLWAAERMAYEMGAKRMQLTAPTESVGEIYKRCKYTLVEVGYQAKLSDRVKH